jgi:hypothetical protein
MEMNEEKTNVMRISKETSSGQIKIDQIQLDNVVYFSYTGSMITNNARCTTRITPRIEMAKAAFNRKKILFTTIQDLNLRKTVVRCYIWSTALYGAKTWIIWKVH